MGAASSVVPLLAHLNPLSAGDYSAGALPRDQATHLGTPSGAPLLRPPLLPQELRQQVPDFLEPHPRVLDPAGLRRTISLGVLLVLLCLHRVAVCLVPRSLRRNHQNLPLGVSILLFIYH